MKVDSKNTNDEKKFIRRSLSFEHCKYYHYFLIHKIKKLIFINVILISLEQTKGFLRIAEGLKKRDPMTDLLRPFGFPFFLE